MAVKRSGFGSVEQLQSGKWRARYKWEGQIFSAPRTFHNKTDAQLFLSDQELELARGTWRAPTRTVKTVEGYGTQWIERHNGLKNSTRQLYRQTFAHHIAPYIGQLRLDKVTPDIVRDYHADLREHLQTTLQGERADIDRPSQVRDGSSTVARSYRLLRSIFTTAVEDEVIQRNPCRIKGAGNAKAAERPTLSLPEVQELAQAMPEHYRALVQLLVWSGIRTGEAAALQRKDLQLSSAAPTLTVRERVYKVKGIYELDTPKSKAGVRTIALPPHLVPIMSEHLGTYTKSDPGALVFTTRTGSCMLNSFGGSMRRALDHIGRRDVRAHDLRHTGMTLAAESGASLPELKHRLGQSTTAAAEGYLHSTQDHGRRIAQRMSELADSQDNVLPINRHTGS
jgi:integrase